MSGQTTARLAGRRVVVLNWRDIRHPQAGGAEHYLHEISRRWAAAGVGVSWLTSKPAGLPEREIIDGVRVARAGGTFSVYARAALRLLRSRNDLDAVVDAQNGTPFFAPAFLRADQPIVQVVHHVHQDQFATRFSPTVAALGRYLEGPLARRVYGTHAIAAVSPSTRTELRRRLGYHGPIFVVPNGTVPIPALTGPRDPDPTIVVVSRLVPHKRIDLLLGELTVVAQRVPRLRVEIVGDGPERSRLEGLVTDLGLGSMVVFRGRLPDAERDELLDRAWLTACTSAAEGWGCSVIEAAVWGTPCVALRVPGIRDSVLDGVTGHLVDGPGDLGPALVDALTALADEGHAREVARSCRAWAGRFTWDRSAELLAGVVLREMSMAARRCTVRERQAERRVARTDMSALAYFPRAVGDDVRRGLRTTDEVVDTDGTTSVLLAGCDEVDAAAALRRVGVGEATVSLVDRQELLAGPGIVPDLGAPWRRTEGGLLASPSVSPR